MASEIVKTVGIIALILAALASFIVFLMKQGFKHLLTKDIEKFKSDLRLAAFEHETRFSKLHERRMKVIEEIYHLLVRAQKAFIDLTRPIRLAGESTEQERQMKAAQTANDLMSFFEENRIYLGEDICLKVEKFYQEHKKVFIIDTCISNVLYYGLEVGYETIWQPGSIGAKAG